MNRVQLYNPEWTTQEGMELAQLHEQMETSGEYHYPCSWNRESNPPPGLPLLNPAPKQEHQSKLDRLDGQLHWSPSHHPLEHCWTPTGWRAPQGWWILERMNGTARLLPQTLERSRLGPPTIQLHPACRMKPLLEEMKAGHAGESGEGS